MFSHSSLTYPYFPNFPTSTTVGHRLWALQTNTFILTIITSYTELDRVFYNMVMKRYVFSRFPSQDGFTIVDLSYLVLPYNALRYSLYPSRPISISGTRTTFWARPQRAHGAPKGKGTKMTRYSYSTSNCAFIDSYAHHNSECLLKPLPQNSKRDCAGIP